MQNITVDFSRVLADNRIEVGFADDPMLGERTFYQGERVLLQETGLEVEGVLHSETRFGKLYWYAIPDWTTRKDEDVVPFLQQQAN
jgi:hypothetical protein